MSHTKYIMKAEEVQVLITSFITYGPEETYNKMAYKALISIDQANDIDEVFLDMSETLSKKAKEEIDNDDSSLLIIYRSLAFMLRRLAHKIYREYIRKGEKRNNSRFLRLISYNEKIPQTT